MSFYLMNALVREINVTGLGDLFPEGHTRQSLFKLDLFI